MKTAWIRALALSLGSAATALAGCASEADEPNARVGLAAETALPYPPGIPALAPCERIQADVLKALQAEVASGTRIAYCGDPSLATLLVVRE